MEVSVLSRQAQRLSREDAFRDVVKALGQHLTTEVMSKATDAERSREALLEFHALQRIVATIDRMAQDALQEELTANGT